MTEPSSTVPTNVDFATDVKSDRLSLLWRVTLGISAVTLMFAFAFLVPLMTNVVIWLAAPLVLGGFCLLTGWLLRRKRYEAASITFALGGFLAVSTVLLHPSELAAEIAPFGFVLVVFLAGLLLSPRMTLGFAVLTTIATLALPALIADELSAIGLHQVFAVVMVWLAALLAAQVTGELYAVTQWALSNYERERWTNHELFESRNELRRALKRSEVLSEQLQESNENLEEARAAAEAAKDFRGKFLANMSHELRTPLNAIIGFSETMLNFPMMYEDQELPPAYHNDLNQIYTSGQQLLRLINDILDLARVDAGRLEIHMQRVQLDGVVDGVLSMAGGLVSGKPLELYTDLPDPLPEIWADETRVRQVLINLYSNAAKFTEEGSITLRVQPLEAGVQFSVIDTGEGIPEDKLEHIFEEFKQANDSGGRDPRAGSGLGLAISRQLLHLMGGSIWAESTVGEGSAFHFILQRYEPSQTRSLTGAGDTQEERAAQEVPTNEEARA